MISRVEDEALEVSKFVGMLWSDLSRSQTAIVRSGARADLPSRGGTTAAWRVPRYFINVF
jgi:hypothetical protein